MMSGSVYARGSRRHVLALVLAMVMLLPGLPVSHAQETTGETDISIVVHPSDVTPVAPGGSSPGTSGASSSTKRLPGTTSARFVQLRENALTERDDDAVMVIMIRDDRGRASGWEVAVNYAPPPAADEPLALVEGQNATIRRLLPEDGRLSDQIDQIGCGRTLGPLSPPVPLLHAPPGSGSGVFVQQIVVKLPEFDPSGEAGVIVVHIPFAP